MILRNMFIENFEKIAKSRFSIGVFFIIFLIGGTAFAFGSIATNNVLIEEAYTDLKGIAFAAGTSIEDFLDEQKKRIINYFRR